MRICNRVIVLLLGSVMLASGQAVWSLDDTNTFIQADADLNLEGGYQQITIEGWVYTTSYDDYSPTYYNKRIDGNTVVCFYNSTFSTKKLSALVRVNSHPHQLTYWTSQNAEILLGQWQHLALVYDGRFGGSSADIIKAYVNGRYARMDRAGAASNTATVPAMNEPDVFGNWLPEVGAYNTDCQFYGWRVWTNSLEQSQIQRIYKGLPVSTNATPLVSVSVIPGANQVGDTIPEGGGFSGGPGGSLSASGTISIASVPAITILPEELYNFGNDGSVTSYVQAAASYSPTRVQNGEDYYRDFDGTNDIVYIYDNTLFTFGTNATLWVKCKLNNSVGTFLANYKNGSPWNGFSFGYGLSDTNDLAFWDGSAWTYFNNTQISDGTWHTAAVVLRGSVIEAYLDGILSETNTFTSVSDNDGTWCRMGLNSAGVNPAQGAISEMYIWNTAISSQDITNLEQGIINTNNLSVKWTMTPAVRPAPRGIMRRKR